MSAHAPARDREIAEWLNQHCHCVALDAASLGERLSEANGALDHMFARYPVFCAESDVAAMRQVISDVETVTALPAYRERVLAGVPPIARHDPGARGVFFGYDFHLGESGPQLIEVNTNAGGALLALATTHAQRGECEACDALAQPAAPLAEFEERIVAMFRAEWRAAGRAGELARVAIVDEAPQSQPLHREFELVAALLERAGLRASIAEPESLHFDGERLRSRSAPADPIDLVYNRSTDFYLRSESSRALRDAYLADAAVLTPHPRAHALYARKSNLALLSDANALAELGVAREVLERLCGHVPETRRVDATHADALWAARKRYYFKPVEGFGSRATYAGAKLTRRTWQAILQGDYVAQRSVAPSRRVALADGAHASLKLDVRHYTYAGETQFVAARLYRGQTTNFRTPGGGFAPVFVAPVPGAPDAPDAASPTPTPVGASAPVTL